MKSMVRFFGLSLFASALGGCAVSASSDVREGAGVAQQAEGAGYLQTFDPYFQSIIFAPASAIDWVILHVTIDGTRTYNVAMPGTGTSAAAGPSYEIEELPVVSGDSVDYSFTYSQNGLAHDTPQFHATLPAGWTPPVFHTEVANGRIAAISAKPLAWADAHYRINGGPMLNVRLAAQGTTYVQPITLNPGDSVEYSVTYSTGLAVFDTAVARVQASAAPARFVVDAPNDGTSGHCVPNGASNGQCNLRAAILAAQSAGAATIDLAVDSTVDGGQITLGTGTLVLESAPGGAAHAITGAGTSRLFVVPSGANATVRNLTITGFRGFDQGAAILNQGALDLEGVTVEGNVTRCEETGAMTAYVTCSAGAIASTGSLTLGGGTTFANNSVVANASTASFTNASAMGGAITSSGTLAIVGPVTFAGNAALATATSGFHPAPIGGADAAASAGAIFNSGTLTVTAPAGTCQFTKNVANATASTPNGTATFTSHGGAIVNTGTVQIPAGACVFTGNRADEGADIDG